MSSSREFDIILWGATGFTGELAANYLAKNYPLSDSEGSKKVNWAIAGRDSKKLTQVKNKLVKLYPENHSLHCLHAELNVESLSALVRRAQVIISTVGPYALYGLPLVEACVKEGTNYVDITGEAQFIKQAIDKFHQTAQEKKLKIISCCGYDSVPSDIGTLLAVTSFQEKYKSKAERVKGYFEAKGSASSGTMLSVFNMMELPKKELYAMNDHAYLLPAEDKRSKLSAQSSVYYDEDIKKTTMPFLMAAINCKVVNRSSALSRIEDAKSSPYGENFTYDECSTIGNKFLGWIITLGLAIFFVVFSLIPPLRKVAKRFFPSGQGPSQETIKTNWFKTTVVAKGDKQAVRVIMAGGDPGYGETSKLLSEAAITMVLEKSRLPQTYGVITPAVGLGLPYVDRLKDAGIKISVE